MILTREYVNEVIKPALERVLPYKLTNPVRKFGYSITGSEISTLGNSTAFPTNKKLFFGNIIAELPCSTNEYKLELYLNVSNDSSIISKRSGKVSSGYNGLTYLPFELQNHYFTYLKLTRYTGNTTDGKFIFDGWEFEIQ